ncbi:MAG: hypothetical protein JSS75_06055 [Bacteroidetes bacterium]|nr:hypothetical protein [Bacteroidota bacterium]
MEQTIVSTLPKAQHISFHCPGWLVAAIDKSIAKTVIANSTEDKLLKYTRSEMIIDSIIRANDFHDPTTTEKALPNNPNE